MILILYKDLLEKSKTRPDGYLDDVISLSSKNENGIVGFSAENYKKLKIKYDFRAISNVKEYLKICKMCKSWQPELLNSKGKSARPCSECSGRKCLIDRLKIGNCPKSKW